MNKKRKPMRHLPEIVAAAILIAGVGVTNGLFAAKCGSMSPETQHAAPTTGPAATTGPATTQGTITKWIADLSSADGKTRIAATKALFALGEDALVPLKQAGAKQITPKPGGTLGGRIDIVYSLLEGLTHDPVAKAGYRADFFLLEVDKGLTADDMTKMGQRCGFTIKARNFTPDGYCGAYPLAGKEFVAVLKAILSDEPTVISVQLTYYAGPTP